MQTWKDDEFLVSVLSFSANKYQEKVSMNFFNGPFGHPGGVMYEQFMGDFT